MGAAQPLGLWRLISRLLLLLSGSALCGGGYYWWQSQQELKLLKGMIERLSGQEHVADIWVEAQAQGIKLKFLPYNTEGEAQEPRYCSFSLNNIVHIETLVVRLSDKVVAGGEGKSLHLFKRAFALDDKGNTYESCKLNEVKEIPSGYRLSKLKPEEEELQRKLWARFWSYTLDPEAREAAQIRNAQIEAPATRFAPGRIYRLKLEHDGGLFIEAQAIPEILKGEQIPKGARLPKD